MSPEGTRDGPLDGSRDGPLDGSRDGTRDRSRDGTRDGPLDGPFEVEVRNLGGIDETTVTFEPGLTILSGRNATNRTSFLKALMAVHGSEEVPLKADAEEGHVRLESAEGTYERHFVREDGHVVASGEPILDDPAVADLFAFLLEDNEARRAVERGVDLREVIMRSVDTAAIETEIDDLIAERGRIDLELAELDDLERRAADLEAERQDLEAEMADKRSDLRANREEIETAEGDLQETREVEAELEEKLDERWSAQSELDDVEYDLETEREGLSSLREELADLEDELDSLAETDAGELEAVEDRLAALRDRKGSITADLNRLQTVVQFNEEMLEGADSELLAALGEESASDSVTDRLVGEESVVCWTCGETVDRSHVVETLDDLRALRQEKLQERNEVDEEIQRLRDERDDLQAQKRRREELEQTIRQRRREIDRREETLSELESRRDELAERVETLAAAVEDRRADQQSELLDLHEAATQLEFEIERLEGDLEDVESNLASIDDRLAGREDLEARRQEVQSELAERRSRVERIEAEAVEAFNEHMETVLERLAYENVARVWIERTGGVSPASDAERAFDLHVVRESEGTVYEDSVDHLSESEREVIGLTFALAGYLVHDVHETVPFMLLDSLEALDSERIAKLVEYMNEYADNVVVALLPEDAAALDEGYERVSEI